MDAIILIYNNMRLGMHANGAENPEKPSEIGGIRDSNKWQDGVSAEEAHVAHFRQHDVVSPKHTAAHLVGQLSASLRMFCRLHGRILMCALFFGVLVALFLSFDKF